MKEIEDNTNRWKDILCSWIGRINIVKMNFLHKTIYRFSAILNKVPMIFSIELGQTTLKFVRKHKRCQIAKTILEKNKTVGMTLPYFKLSHTVAVIKTIRY